MSNLQLLRVWKQVVVNPGREDGRFHRHHPRLRKRSVLTHASNSRRLEPILLSDAHNLPRPSRNSDRLLVNVQNGKGTTSNILWRSSRQAIGLRLSQLELGEESYSFESSRAFRWQEKALDLGIQLGINRANLIEGALLLPEEA